MQEEPDRELLRRFAHGDREAFEALFRQFEHAPRWSYVDLSLRQR